jgi:DNA topoisomerase I
MSDKYNLVIVESKGKVDKITKYLNNNPALKSYGKFVVMASFGHIRDLPPKSLGIDFEKNFAMTYEFTEAKKQVIEDIKKKAQNAKAVFIASDTDKEGEFIGESLRLALNLGQNYKRIVFTEISPKALEYAVNHPGKIDQNQLESQETRRALDRLVGYKLSPVLWRKFNAASASHLSAGRVQSAVLHILIKKEQEIQKFKTSPYWSYQGEFTLTIKTDSQKIEEVKLYKGDTIHKEDDQESVKSFLKKIKNDFTIKDVKTKESRQKPPLPFITSTLQQEAGFPVKRTMQLAQDLYEAGLISYMRTDSYSISEDFKTDATKYIQTAFGVSYLGDQSDMKQAKTVKGAQEAHECIRPVDITKTTAKGEGAKITKDHEKLYDLIWKRTVAYFMKSCIYDELDIKIVDSSFVKDTYFIATFKKVKFNGFQLVYGVKTETYDFSKYTSNLITGNYDIKCSNITAKNTWTSPPTRFSEPSIIKVMEADGIGRPSTYSAILQKVTDRQYVIKTDVKGEDKQTTNFVLDPKQKTLKEQKGTATVGHEKGKFVPTEIGIEVDKFLQANFDYIIDASFTAHMEADMDRIADGKKSRIDVLKAFWSPFSKDLAKFDKISKENKIKIETESNDFTVKGKKYTIRLTRFGPVIQHGEKEYIDLKNYLKYTGKEYTDVDEHDITFLIKFPYKVGESNGKTVEAYMGPYGLYLKHDNKNLKITAKMIREFMETGKFSPKDIESSIEYNRTKAKSQPKKSSNKVKTV